MFEKRYRLSRGIDIGSTGMDSMYFDAGITPLKQVLEIDA